MQFQIPEAAQARSLPPNPAGRTCFGPWGPMVAGQSVKINIPAPKKDAATEIAESAAGGERAQPGFSNYCCALTVKAGISRERSCSSAASYCSGLPHDTSHTPEFVIRGSEGDSPVWGGRHERNCIKEGYNLTCVADKLQGTFAQTSLFSGPSTEEEVGPVLMSTPTATKNVSSTLKSLFQYSHGGRNGGRFAAIRTTRPFGNGTMICSSRSLSKCQKKYANAFDPDEACKGVRGGDCRKDVSELNLAKEWQDRQRGGSASAGSGGVFDDCLPKNQNSRRLEFEARRRRVQTSSRGAETS